MRVLQLIPFVGWSSSVLLHAGVFAILLRIPHDVRQAPPSSLVSFSVSSMPNPRAKLASSSPAPPAPGRNNPSRAVTQKVLAATAAPRPPSSTPTAAPVDLTGVTLTGGDGADWSSMTGNGQAMDTPIRPTVVATAPTNPSPIQPKPIATTSGSHAPEIVAMRDLATKPMPPLLDALLLSNYPPDARRQGLAGKAVVVARVDADGLIRHTTIRSETRSGFGAACERTLLGSRWSTPRDRGGRPVATQISYTCDFRVDR